MLSNRVPTAIGSLTWPVESDWNPNDSVLDDRINEDEL